MLVSALRRNCCPSFNFSAMSAKFEIPWINTDPNEILHLNSWDEYDAHVCVHCKRRLELLMFSDVPSDWSIKMDLLNERLQKGAKSGCLQYMLILRCLEWATLKLGYWDSVEYIYQKDVYGVSVASDWKAILSIRGPQLQYESIEVNIGNSKAALTRSPNSSL